MELLIRSEKYFCNPNAIKNIDNVEYDMSSDRNIKWILSDTEKGKSSEISTSLFSMCVNHLLQYIIYYQKDNLLSVKYAISNRINASNVIVSIYVNTKILLEKLETNNMGKNVHFLLHMIMLHKNKHQKMLSYEWKEAYIPDIAISPYGQSDKMKLRLYKYQLDTLNWMINIEQNKTGYEFNNMISLDKMLKIKNLWIDMARKKIMYENVVYDKMYTRGGILADEMGLGKTITTIALICSNINDYKMKDEKGMFNTKATLVLCPSHLAKQWKTEINKACPLLNTVICLTKTMHKKISYQDIIDADIVIVSFQFLTNYKYYLRLGTDKSVTLSRLMQPYFRNIRNTDLQQKLNNLNKMEKSKQLEEKIIQFEFFNWHRLVIDEGHEIFSNMTYGYGEDKFLGDWIMRTKSKYRWFVSGTPFVTRHGFENALKFIDWYVIIDGNRYLYADLLYMKIDIEQLNTSIVNKMYMRNTKDSVGDEYDVPPIVEQTIFLEFTDFEKSMYANYVSKNYGRMYLRQLCCHPYVSDKDSDAFEEIGSSLEEARLSLLNYNKSELEKEKKKLQNLKKDKTQYDYKGKIKRCNEKINQCKYMVSFFSAIDPIVPQTDDDNCSICLSEYDDLVITDCGHFYCKECIQECLNMSGKSCPMCRQNLTLKQIHPIKVKDVKKSVDTLTSKYGTKMGKLISVCRKLFLNKKNRIIIFSQWDKMLHMIGNTLKENDINTVICKGNVHQRNAAIRSFKKGWKKTKKDIVRVIMLSLDNAASGTNLIEATHIILIDPVEGTKEKINAIEGQAIGRAHRIGQNKPVKVIRLIIKDTVEEELYKRSGYSSLTENNISSIEDMLNDL